MQPRSTSVLSQCRQAFIVERSAACQDRNVRSSVKGAQWSRGYTYPAVLPERGHLGVWASGRRQELLKHSDLLGKLLVLTLMRRMKRTDHQGILIIDQCEMMHHLLQCMTDFGHECGSPLRVRFPSQVLLHTESTMYEVSLEFP